MLYNLWEFICLLVCFGFGFWGLEIKLWMLSVNLEWGVSGRWLVYSPWERTLGWKWGLQSPRQRVWSTVAPRIWTPLTWRWSLPDSSFPSGFLVQEPFGNFLQHCKQEHEILPAIVSLTLSSKKCRPHLLCNDHSPVAQVQCFLSPFSLFALKTHICVALLVKGKYNKYEPYG